MNTRNPIVESPTVRPDRFLSVNFNQDHTCFSCSTEDGFQVYNTDPLDCKVVKKFNNLNQSGVAYTKMLYRTNYIALIGGGRRPRYPPNKLIIWDDLQQRESITLSFMSPVHEVFLSRVHIIVVLENTIEVYQFGSNPHKIVSSLDTVRNAVVDFVVCARKLRRSSSEQHSNGLSPAVTTGILAFPSVKSPGQVQIADLSQLKVKEDDNEPQLPTSIIKAHKSPIRLIGLNPQGTKVATCSIQGTMIRVFSTHTGSLIKEFRRGLDRADIYEISWSRSGKKLACVSDKQTLHVFQIEDEEDNRDANKTHMFKDYVPLIWKPKYLDSTWSMCSKHLKSPLRHENDVDTQLHRDRCKIGWCGGDDGEEDCLVLVWKQSGIWEKYVILEKEDSPGTYSVNETLRQSGQQRAKKQWELVRESWRQL